MPGRVPGQCPSVPVPVTLVPHPWHSGTLAGSVPAPPLVSQPDPAQPSFVGSKGHRDSERAGVAPEELAPLRQGLPCCKTLSRHQQDFGLAGPHKAGTVSLCLLSQDGS